jgi:hypothetical protein|tara:strand:+ start:153 stop:497 length:345 start_codon:yes stop_codon:yes gene_type:complete
MLPIIVSTVGGLVKTWLSNKAEKQQAKHTQSLESIKQTTNWETTQAEASQSSWKDEWFTIILSVPLIMCFIPSLVPYVKEGFTVLESMPDFYKTFLGAAIAASFGIKSLAKWKK